MAQSLAVSREFFGRPQGEKEQLKIRQPDGARGYQVLGENVTQYKGQFKPLKCWSSSRVDTVEASNRGFRKARPSDQPRFARPPPPRHACSTRSLPATMLHR